jgi:hypothetical protein
VATSWLQETVISCTFQIGILAQDAIPQSSVVGLPYVLLPDDLDFDLLGAAIRDLAGIDPTPRLGCLRSPVIQVIHLLGSGCGGPSTRFIEPVC